MAVHRVMGVREVLLWMLTQYSFLFSYQYFRMHRYFKLQRIAVDIMGHSDRASSYTSDVQTRLSGDDDVVSVYSPTTNL